MESRSDRQGPGTLELLVIINCGPCAPFIGRCLHSLRSQTYENWRGVVTVDPCGDATLDEAVRGAHADERIRVRQNALRRYALANLVDALLETPLDPEGVIVILDGDDWLNVDDALTTVVETYERHTCWMTYGSWVSDIPGCPAHPWHAYPDNTVDFRAAPWLATHLRTWKRWLWDLIIDDDLRDEDGSYFRVAVDLAVMIPLLEICGTEKARHIDQPLYHLNRRDPSRTDDRRYHEQQRNERLIRSRPSYPRRSACLPQL
jgi:glycosyltransferase involved in cell wall biosynthesis